MWSATPTPFNQDLSIDRESVRRMVEHQRTLGVSGLMLGGTCGEGPWMTAGDLCELTKESVAAAGNDMTVTVQVTDNSPRRILERAEKVAEAGAQIAVLSAPFFLMNALPVHLLNFYREVIRRSPIPVGIYDRGKAANYPIDNSMLEELLAEPNLVMVKDSSQFSSERAELIAKVRKQKSNFRIFWGDEFTCVAPIEGGYDGLLLGGSIFNARLATAIMQEVNAGRLEEAKAIQNRMNDLMYRVYGGQKIECWLTGLKYLLVEMGIFATTQSYLNYPLTDSCRAAIDEIVRGADESGFRRDLSLKELQTA